MRGRRSLRAKIIIGCLIASLLLLGYARFLVSAQADRIIYGESVQGTLDGENTQDDWVLDGVRGDVIRVTVRVLDGALRPSFKIIDPDEVIVLDLGWPEGADDLSISTTLRASGPYTVLISNDASSTGRYEILVALETPGPAVSLEENQASDVLVYGRAVQGAITDEQFRQFWLLRGTRGDVVDLLMMRTDGDLDGYLALVSPDGTVLAVDDSSGNETDAALFSVRLPLTGIYTVVARRAGTTFGENGETSGTYELLVSLRQAGSDDAIPAPTPLTLGKPLLGQLTADAPVALFSAESNGVLAISLETRDSLEAVRVNVMSSTEVLLKSVSGVSPLRFSLPTAGIGPIWIEVEPAANTDTREIQFQLMASELVVAPETSRAIWYGRTRVLNGESGAQAAYWHFEARAGDHIALEIVPFLATETGTAQVFAPDGTLLFERPIAVGIILPAALQSTGFYEVVLSSEVVQTGYQISLARVGVENFAIDQVPGGELLGDLREINGTVVDGEVIRNEARAWSLDVHQEGAWLFRLMNTNEGSNVPLAVVVEGPDGAVLSGDATGGSGNRVELGVELAESGRYRVIVFAPGHPIRQQSFRLEALPVEGGIVSVPASVRGVLGDGEAADLWHFDLPSGATVHASFSSGLAGLDAMLLGPDGNRVATLAGHDPSDGSQFLTALVEEGGVYSLRVSQDSNAPRTVYDLELVVDSVIPGAYQLAVESSAVLEASGASESAEDIPIRVDLAALVRRLPADPVQLRSESQVLSRDTLARGVLDSEQLYDSWSFQVIAGQVLEFSARALSENAQPAIRLLNADGDLVAERIEADSESLSLAQRFPVSGTYYLVVSTAQPTQYTLWASALGVSDLSLPELIAGQVIDFGQTLPGEVLSPDDETHYVFYARAGDSILATASRSEGNARYELLLKDAAGTLIEAGKFDQVVATAELEADIPGTGLYQLVLSPVGEDEKTAAVSVHLEMTRSTNEIVAPGGILQRQFVAQLASRQEEQRWLFAASAGEQVSIEVQALLPSGRVPTRLSLADTGGNVFRTASLAPDATRLSLQDQILPEDGVYQVIVAGGQNTNSLYRLTFERESGYEASVSGAIQYDQTVSGVLVPNDFLDVWTFSGTAGDEIAVTLQRQLGSPAALSLQIRDSNGYAVTTLGGGAEDAIVTGTEIVLPSSGYYSLVVGDPAGGLAGNLAYNLSLSLLNTAARSMGTVIPYDSLSTGVLFVDDPADTWLFEGHQGDVISVAVEAASGDALPSLTLTSSDWHIAAVAGRPEVLAEALSTRDAFAAIDQYTLPADGTYAIVVRELLNAGNYVLRLSADLRRQGAVQLASVGETRDGQLAPGNTTDTWMFLGQQNSIVAIEARPDSRSQLAPSIQLVDREGRSLVSASVPVGGTARIASYQLPYDGEYFVRVMPRFGRVGRSVGRYTLSIEEVAQAVAPEISGEIGYGALRRGLLDRGNPDDIWLFAGDDGGVVRFVAERTSGDLDPVIIVYAPDGSWLGGLTSPDGQRVELTLQLRETGIYTVEVIRYRREFGLTEGNYALTVERVYQGAPITDGQVMAYGDQIMASVDNVGSIDRWIFLGEQGDQIAVRVRFPAIDLPLTLSLRDPVGNVLAQGVRNVGNTEILAYALPATGRYVIEVQRLADRDPGNFTPYEIRLNLEKSPITQMASGGEVLSGQLVSGYLSPADAIHTWYFAGRADQLARITLNRIDGVFPSQISVMDPSGQILLSTEVSNGEGAWSWQSSPLPQSGIYQLQIKVAGEGLGGTYRLLLELSDAGAEDEHLISPSQDVYGYINDLAPSKRWRFDVQVGEIFSVRAAVTNGDLAPNMILWSPSGKLVGQSVSENYVGSVQAAIDGVVAGESGTYELVIGRQGEAAGQTSGAYRLQVRPRTIAPEALLARRLAFGQIVSESVTGNVTRYFSFDAYAGDVISGALLLSTGDALPGIALRFEDGTLIDTSWIRGEGELSISDLVLPKTGRYIAIVDSPVMSTYQLGFFRREPLSETGGTRVMGLNQGFVDAVFDAELPTIWSFNAELGDVITVSVDTTGSLLRSDISLFGPMGYVAGKAAGPVDRIVTLGPLRLPESGTYVLHVGAWMRGLGNSTGRFTVRVDNAPEGVSGSDGGYIGVRQKAMSGGLIPGDSRDVWTFDGRAGETIAVQFIRTAGEGSATVTLLSPEGVVLDSVSSDVPLLKVSGALPKDGRYVLEILGEVARGSDIEYRLTVQSHESVLQSNIADAQGISLGDRIQGTLAAGQTHVAWVFYGHAQDMIWIDLQAEETSGNELSLSLLSPTGDVVAQGRVSSSAQEADFAHVLLPSDGFYGVVVSRTTGDNEAEYALSVEQVSIPQALAGTLSQSVAGMLSADMPAQQWRYVPFQSGTYAFEVTARHGGKSPVLMIETVAGELLGVTELAENGSFRVVARLEQGGDYRVMAVAPTAAHQGEYELVVSPAVFVQASGLLLLAESDVGRITSQHFSDEWRVSGVNAEFFVVRVMATAGDLMPVVMVYDDNGTTLGQSSADSSELAVTVSAEGAVFPLRIIVTRAGGAGGSTSGDYAIGVESLP